MNVVFYILDQCAVCDFKFILLHTNWKRFGISRFLFGNKYEHSLRNRFDP